MQNNRKKSQGLEISLKTNRVIFKGKFLNGSKNGLGDEFDCKTGKLIFQGNYLNGKRNGKGKKYDQNIKCIFDGEYLNGKKNGNGKEMRNGKVISEGKYKEGKIWTGKGFNEKREKIYEIIKGNSKYFIEFNDKGKKFMREYI